MSALFAVAAGFMTLAVFARFVRPDSDGGYDPYHLVNLIIYCTCCFLAPQYAQLLVASL